MDYISQLPDEIIHHILSFLFMKDAIKTSVLSKRWLYQWTFNPNLDFSFLTDTNDQGALEASAIFKCINRYKPTKLHRFHVDLNFPGKYSVLIKFWINFAVERKAEELDICVKFDNHVYFNAPLSLFYSESIRVLKLKSCIFRLPSDFKGFPLLKTLHLNSIQVDDSGIIQALVSSCPCLESLELLDIKNIKHLEIKNTMSVQNLFVSGLEGIDILDGPNLRYFRCNGYNLKRLRLNKAPSLATVDISSVMFAPTIETVPAEAIRAWKQFFLDVSHVQCLTVNTYFIQLLCAQRYLNRNDRERIVFKNLKIFNLNGKANDKFTMYALVSFFGDCPLLENVKIDFKIPWRVNENNWISSFMENEHEHGRVHYQVVDCLLLYNLKIVRLDGFSGRALERMLVEVVFGKAAALEKLFLYLTTECITSNYKLLLKELTSYAKRSRYAKIIVETGLWMKRPRDREICQYDSFCRQSKQRRSMVNL